MPYCIHCNSSNAQGGQGPISGKYACSICLAAEKRQMDSWYGKNNNTYNSSNSSYTGSSSLNPDTSKCIDKICTCICECICSDETCCDCCHKSLKTILANIMAISWIIVWLVAIVGLFCYVMIQIMLNHPTYDDYMRYTIIGMSTIHIVVFIYWLCKVEKGLTCNDNLGVKLCASMEITAGCVPLQAIVNLISLSMGIYLLVNKGSDTYLIEKIGLVFVPSWGMFLYIFAIIIKKCCTSKSNYTQIL